MKILITGGCGYIGSHVVSLLNEKEYSLTVIDDFSTGSERNKRLGVKYVKGGLGDAALLEEAFSGHRFDAVIHLAAKTSVEESMARPDFYHRENTQNTVTLIEACQKHHVKTFLFSSTAAVYSADSDKRIQETDPINPMSPYGQSKYDAECHLTDFCKSHEINCVIFRYFNVAGHHRAYGVGSHKSNETALIPTSVTNILLGRPFIVNGNDYETKDGTCIRDYIHVMDIAKVHDDALQWIEHSTESLVDVFNVGYGTGYSVLDIYKKLRAFTAEQIECHIAPRRPGDVVFSVANSEKIKKVVGWASMYEHPLDEMIHSEFLWRRENALKVNIG